MVRSTIIVLLFFSATVVGQAQNNLIYNNINGLKRVDSIFVQDIIGCFSTSDGFCGNKFVLDSNMTFMKSTFDCAGNRVIDSGTWRIKGNRTLILSSGKKDIHFDLVKFDKFYFLILPRQRLPFIHELIATKAKLKNAKSFKLNDKIYSVEYIISFYLALKYYAKDLN